jgi:arsenate reductase (thioredoxin)
LKRVLFVCIENAGRSQMAEAFANHYGKGKIVAQSAGIKLANEVNPVAVTVMKEKGIDISANKPKMLTQQMVKDSDIVITMGCGVGNVCPGPFFKETIDWHLEDPKGQPVEKVREIRDEIERQVKQLITEQKSTQGASNRISF